MFAFPAPGLVMTRATAASRRPSDASRARWVTVRPTTAPLRARTPCSPGGAGGSRCVPRPARLGAVTPTRRARRVASTQVRSDRLEGEPGRQIGRQRERTEQFAEPHDRTSSSGARDITCPGADSAESRGMTDVLAIAATVTPPDTTCAGADSAESRGMADFPLPRLWREPAAREQVCVRIRYDAGNRDDR